MSTFPPKTTFLQADYYGSRNGHDVIVIIGHDTETPTIDGDSTNYLKTGGGRKVSIHALIHRDGSITEMVKDDDAANHAGYGTLHLNGRTYEPDGINLNAVSLGFELEHWNGPTRQYTDDQLLSMVWLIATWRAKHGPLPIFRHADVDPTRREDTRFLSVDEIEQWVQKAQVAMGQTPTPAPTVWDGWGASHPLAIDRRNWAIPRMWKAYAQRLGKAQSDETYPTPEVSYVIFEHGVIVYAKATGHCYPVVF